MTSVFLDEKVNIVMSLYIGHLIERLCWTYIASRQGGWFSRTFLFKEFGRLEEAANECKRIIKMLDEHHDSSYLEVPKKELAIIEESLSKIKYNN